MSLESQDLWRRAVEALGVSQREAGFSPDAAASRAYYAAFYAVSALFALEGRTFTKHSGVEAAVHRDLVRQGRWNKELGATYTELLRLREVGNYGGERHVTSQQAYQAAGNPRALLEAISRSRPDQFLMPEPED